jgi:glutamine transport system substrate-binding protein
MKPTMHHAWTLLALLALASLTPPLDAAGAPLKVGMDPRSAPWAFVPGADNSGVDFRSKPSLSRADLARLEGIDVDVSRALAEEMDRPVTIVPVAYHSLEQALLDGEIDLIVNAFNRTRETAASIRASDPYYPWGLLIAARADDARFKQHIDLRGRRVGHFESQLVNRTLYSLGAGELKAYDNEDRLFEDLKAGEIDAVVYDSPAVRWRAKNDDALKVVGDPLNKLGYHVGVRAADAELFQGVQDAIRALTDAGTLAAIQSRWEQP